MWQIENRTPFAVEQGWIRNRDGAEVWLVVVKATFDVASDGKVDVAALQPPPLRVPEYNGEPGQSSVRHESDFVLTKRTTDVWVHGEAHAPGGEPLRSLDVGFRVGAVRKLVRVFGERVWGPLGISEPQPFVKMPIVYERAYGGVDRDSGHPDRDWEWRNPVGCGYAVASAHLSGRLLPNIEAADRLIKAWDDRPDPAGFGPIASHWQPRAGLAGTYDAQWEATRQPLLPVDLDDGYFQAVPADQQTAAFLEGGEPVTVLNMSAGGRIDFYLPHLSFQLSTRFSDGERRVHEPPNMHSLILEPGLSRFSMVWHSALECHAKVYKLNGTRVEWQSAEHKPDGEDTVESLLDLV